MSRYTIEEHTIKKDCEFLFSVVDDGRYIEKVCKTYEEAEQHILALQKYERENPSKKSSEDDPLGLCP